MRSRVIALGGVVVAAAALAACGSGGSGASNSPTPTRIPPTNYVTIAPATTSTTQPGQTTLPGTELQPEQPYTIKAGDYPLKIAKSFNVTLAALIEANGWNATASDFPGVGTVIRIPAGGTLEGVTTTVAGQPSTQTTGDGQTTTTVKGATTTTAKSTTTIKGGQSNCAAGTYTIVQGDTPSGVAKKFGTTVDALNAVNADTKYYSSFAVGIVIKIPAKTAC
jgi:LysM repeat protein